MLLRRSFLASLGLLGATSAARAAYPDSPIRLIIPFPGGSGEVQARIVTKALAKIIGQPIVVQGQPGAGGNVAANYVAKAQADGYTMFLGVSTIFEINPLIYKPETYRSMGFDPVADLAPVSLLSEQQFVLVTNPNVPAKSIAELITYAKANPGKLTVATSGVGSPLYLAAIEFMSQSGVKILDVPYKGGGEDSLALLSGTVDLLFGSIPDVRGNIESGKMRALGVTGIKRLKLLPDVPTIAESGLPNYNVTIWSCISVPAATPKPIVQRLQAAIMQTIAQPDVVASMEQIGLEPLSSTGEEVARRIQTETPIWRTALKTAGVAAQ